MNFFGVLFIIFAFGVALDLAVRIYIFAHTKDQETAYKVKHEHWWWTK